MRLITITSYGRSLGVTNAQCIDHAFNSLRNRCKPWEIPAIVKSNGSERRITIHKDHEVIAILYADINDE